MTVRLERAVRSLDGVARVHVNRWGDGSSHLHLWFMARPYGRLQLRGAFLSMWDEILPPIPEHQWRENLALVAAWLADFGGQALAEPPRIDWQSPATITPEASASWKFADSDTDDSGFAAESAASVEQVDQDVPGSRSTEPVGAVAEENSPDGGGLQSPRTDEPQPAGSVAGDSEGSFVGTLAIGEGSRNGGAATNSDADIPNDGEATSNDRVAERGVVADGTAEGVVATGAARTQDGAARDEVPDGAARDGGSDDDVAQDGEKVVSRDGATGDGDPERDSSEGVAANGAGSDSDVSVNATPNGGASPHGGVAVAGPADAVRVPQIEGEVNGSPVEYAPIDSPTGDVTASGANGAASDPFTRRVDADRHAASVTVNPQAGSAAAGARIGSADARAQAESADTTARIEGADTDAPTRSVDSEPPNESADTSAEADAPIGNAPNASPAASTVGTAAAAPSTVPPSEASSRTPPPKAPGTTRRQRVPSPRPPTRPATRRSNRPPLGELRPTGATPLSHPSVARSPMIRRTRWSTPTRPATRPPRVSNGGVRKTGTPPRPRSDPARRSAGPGSGTL